MHIPKFSAYIQNALDQVSDEAMWKCVQIQLNLQRAMPGIQNINDTRELDHFVIRYTDYHPVTKERGNEYILVAENIEPDRDKDYFDFYYRKRRFDTIENFVERVFKDLVDNKNNPQRNPDIREGKDYFVKSDSKP